MMIHFDKLEETLRQDFRGGKKECRLKIHKEESVRFMRGILPAGASIGKHIHENNEEIIYVLEGSGYIIDDGKEEKIEAGQCNYCPKGHSHSLMNAGNRDLTFLAIIIER